MNDFSTQIQIDAPADEVFAFVTDFNNMPKYLPMVNEVIPTGDGHLRMQAEVKGKTFEKVAWFQTHEFNRTMLWGAAGANQYSGDLEVMDQGQGCLLSINVKFEALPEMNEEERKDLQARVPEIRKDLDKAAERIKELCERASVPRQEKTRGYAL